MRQQNTTITVSKGTLEKFNEAKPFESTPADEFLNVLIETYEGATESVEDRFNERWAEDDNGCWIWTGLQDGNGYGNIYVHSRSEQAHRVSYQLHKGAIPDGKFVLHTCDVRECVNPEHLYAGTNSDNQKDRWERTGHSAGGDKYTKKETGGSAAGQAGANNPNAAFTHDEAEEIRGRYATGEYSQTELAEECGVSVATICRLVNRKRYVESTND